MKYNREQKNTNDMNQMAKPAYPAYQAYESIGDKLGIAFKRCKKRIAEKLNRAKNWIQSHRGSKDAATGEPSVNDEENVSYDSKEVHPAEKETDQLKPAPEGATAENTEPATTDGYIGKHARRA